MKIFIATKASLDLKLTNERRCEDVYLKLEISTATFRNFLACKLIKLNSPLHSKKSKTN